MKPSFRSWFRKVKSRVLRRLDKKHHTASAEPVFSSSNIDYDVSHRDRATSYGGIGLIQLLVRKLGLAKAIDQRVEVLKLHMPYHESDHVLNIAYNALCDGTCLEDIELRRNDEAYLDALGAPRIPDPTTAGDFCRRFRQVDIENLQDAIDVSRTKVWSEQPAAFFDRATIDMDRTIVETTGECKAGMDISYNG